MKETWSYYSKFNSKIVDAFANLSQTKFILVDGGAAGHISEPFDIAQSAIQSFRFEPRAAENVNLTDNDIYIDGGLWSKDTNGELHIANDPTTSSICPPNYKFLSQFDDNYGVPCRRTKKTKNVPLRSIDSCVKNNELPFPHFIKLDIHSSEVPALMGAAESLQDCVGLLVETWNSEVHLGQGLHYEVERFAIKNGFEVYESICAARWQVKHKEKVNFADRGRYIGSEVLFIRKEVTNDLLLHKAFVLALFGFYNDALNVVSQNEVSKNRIFFKAILRAQLSVSRSFNSRMKRVLRKLYNYFL